jgi:hypothetical protein
VYALSKLVADGVVGASIIDVTDVTQSTKRDNEETARNRVIEHSNKKTTSKC